MLRILLKFFFQVTVICTVHEKIQKVNYMTKYQLIVILQNYLILSQYICLQGIPNFINLIELTIVRLANKGSLQFCLNKIQIVVEILR